MLRQLLIMAAVALAAPAVQAAEAGTIIFVAGEVRVGDHAAVLNGSIGEGELLSTGKDGSLYIKTIDNGLFILRPATKARIAAYHVDRANPANTRIKLELLSGVARSQSGEAVKAARQNFRFNTPVAAIGVRGTDFTVFTDQDTSRVAVISGGITISGFTGACRPDGIGPCEGSSSRELSATQRGQLLQFHRGQVAPQLLQDATLAPDVSAPPRPEEPAGKQGGGGGGVAGMPGLEAQKTVAIQQLTQNTAGGKNPPDATGIVTVPPISEVSPPVTPTPPVVVTPPVVTPPVVTPPVVTPPVVVPPVLPERQIVWGRWQPVLDLPVKVDFVAELNKGSELVSTNDDFALMRTQGKDYLIPERGSVGFELTQSEAYIHSDNTAIPVVVAKVENGVLKFNFDNRTFATSFDVVNKTERIALQSKGDVASDGRFSGESRFNAPTNMALNGVLSSENGGTAAYLFDARLSGNRAVYGATLWRQQAVVTKP
ncbi:FecR domain-containing protein [Duganella violaceipulchra]|uniref:FecR protein domain-containing protein n=1 Tax=Duganella violaceipulchra TaxID=2849652 RepID=A0ABT1GTE3_9BURK|nr:FecR family protein [Duganella violaceicalia]MCP2012273.1 hypothetical protein [Duganella violaceicalia]